MRLWFLGDAEISMLVSACREATDRQAPKAYPHSSAIRCFRVREFLALVRKGAKPVASSAQADCPSEAVPGGRIFAL